MDMKATELRLGLPGSTETVEETVSWGKSNKRPMSETDKELKSTTSSGFDVIPRSKAQIVGWPPVRSNRKNIFETRKKLEVEGLGMFVKVSMDGAPYLRKIDLKVFEGYTELLKTLETMFSFSLSESDNVPTYEDKDGDWMLLGDVPWEMFKSSCKRLRIMKGSEAKDLGCGL